ncbi:MAG: regulatory protein RecX [Dehalococcoidia bacterium]|nr:regulatory protein RecX [Dehalococcoidia bacterium]
MPETPTTENEKSTPCLNAAYLYLSYRPRSEGEMRNRLSQRGFKDNIIDGTINTLLQQGLLDDYKFAEFWKENRLTFKPRSKRLIKKELLDKSVSRDIVEQVIQDIDDEGNAYVLGRNRLYSLEGLNYADFYRRLSSFLVYRGFPYEIIRRIIVRLWREKETQQE